MLDTEPTDESTTAGESDSPAPAKKAARKAPAKRAPRKAAAKAAPTVPDAVAEPVVAEPAAPEAPSTEPAADEAPAAKPRKTARPRKAAAKKVAPAAEPSPAVAEFEAAGSESVPAEAAPAEVASAEAVEAAEPAAPTKRTPRKRVSKAAAARAAADAEALAATQDEATPADEPETEPAGPALVAPAVLFQPPSETLPSESKAPTRRRRSSRPVLAEPPPAEPALEEPGEEFAAVAATELADGEQLPAADTLIDPAVDETASDEDDTDETAADSTGDDASEGSKRRRRRGRRGRGSRSGDETTAETIAPVDADATSEDDDVAESDEDESSDEHADEVAESALSASARRRRRRRRSTGADGADAVSEDDPPNTVVHVRDSAPAARESSRDSGRGSGSNRGGAADEDGVRGVKGSTRLEAKRQRRRDNRDSGRKRAPILTEAEFLARREAVDRVMAVRQTGDRTQIAVLEDDILVEHYVTRASASSAVGNVYLGRVQNVLPSMEAAFIDIGRGRNGVLYAGEVNWDTAGLEGKARSIENALNPGDTVLVQVTKDPIGHKGARLTSQISLPGRFVVYVPGGGMTGISRKLPDVERSRLKAILKKVVPDEAGVIVRTAAEGASEEDLVSDVERLKTEWDSISAKAAKNSDGPTLVHGEPDLAIRVVRDIFNDDFGTLIVSGSDIHRTIADYVSDIAPDLADRISLHTAESDLFRDLRVDEQLVKALDRKVWLPSGGSLVIDRTEAMTVVDVNTGKYTGSGGNLEQTVTRNNLEAAEEIVRQLRLRDLGGIVVIDFIDMVLESNRELVHRRLTECLGRDRTKHQVAEVTSLGLVQMTRKRVGEGLLEAFSENCPTCNGRGVLVHLDPVEKKQSAPVEEDRSGRGKRTRKAKSEPAVRDDIDPVDVAAENEKRRAAATAIAAIAAATTTHHDDDAMVVNAGSNGSVTLPEDVLVSTGSSNGSESEPEPGSVTQPSGTAPVAAGRSRRRSARSESVTPRHVEVEPVRAEPAATVSEPEPAAPVEAQSTPDAPRDNGQTSSAAASVPSTRPRRRRAASRPAGPPVATGATTAG